MTLCVCLAEVLAFSDKLADRKAGYIKPLDALAGDKINAPAFADVVGKKGLCLGKKHFGFRIEYNLVYRFEGYGIIVDVNKLGKCIARRCSFIFRLRQRLFHLFPVPLCGGKAVISVAHCKDYRVIRRAVFVLQNGLVAKLFGSLCKLFGVRHKPAGDAAAVLHQLKVIDLFAFRDGGKNDVIRIIHEYHDVRHLKRSVPADADARRQSILNGVLCCAYRAVRSLGPVIGLKIEHAH